MQQGLRSAREFELQIAIRQLDGAGGQRGAADRGGWLVPMSIDHGGDLRHGLNNFMRSPEECGAGQQRDCGSDPPRAAPNAMGRQFE